MRKTFSRDLFIDALPKLQAFIRSLGVTQHQENQDLLIQTFTHKSFASDYDDPIPDNERLEFLGDSVLGCVIASALYNDYPMDPESQLTLTKIYLVKEETLARAAVQMKVGEYIFLGKGEERVGWRDKESILSDCLEALIGYIYLTCGRNDVETFVKKHIYKQLDELTVLPSKSYKNQLQELVQKRLKDIPTYEDEVVEEEPSGNVTLYKSSVLVEGTVRWVGEGPSKKKAQEQAAQEAYNRLAEHRNEF